MLLVLRDRVAQGGDAGPRRVLVLAVADRVDRGLHHLGRAVGVGEPLPEVHRPRLDRELRHLREDRRAEALQARREIRDAFAHCLHLRDCST